MPPNSNMTAKIYFRYAVLHTHNHVRVESSSCCFPRGLSDSLHSSKTWGRLTLIEKNLDYSDSFQYPDFFCIAPFMSINQSHLGFITTFPYQTKPNSPNKKRAAGCNRMQQRDMKTDRIASQVLTRTFMSHNLQIYLPYHTCSYVFLFRTRARIQKSDAEANILRNIYFFDAVIISSSFALQLPC